MIFDYAIVRAGSAGCVKEGLNKGLANGCQPLKLYQPMTVLE